MQREWVYILWKASVLLWKVMRGSMVTNLLSKLKKTLFLSFHRFLTHPRPRAHTYTSANSSVSRPGSVRALCCWQCWRPQCRQVSHSSSLLPSPSHLSASRFCARQITVVPASLAASQAQLEKMQANWWMDAITGVRAIYGLANTGPDLIKIWRNCQSLLTSVEYKTQTDILWILEF